MMIIKLGLVIIIGEVFTIIEIEGAETFARRYGRYALEDFLCRTLPALSSSNGSLDIDPNPHDEHTFRLQNTCMECHQTIDAISGVLRNVAVERIGAFLYEGVDAKCIGSSSNCEKRSTWGPSIVQIYTPSEESSSSKGGGTSSIIWPSSDEEAEGFYQTTAYGRLTFDDILGTRIDEELDSVDTLGEKMVETIDFYACAAKRYFHFLTGSNIPLFSDYTDDSSINPFRYDSEGTEGSGELTSKQLEKFEYIRKLGISLRSSEGIYSYDGGFLPVAYNIKSLQDLIRHIISSDYFLESILGSSYSSSDDDTDTDTDTDSSSSETTYVSDSEYSTEEIKTILEDSTHGCTGCHGLEDWDINNFVTETWPKNSNGNTVVSPGDPCNSYLITRLDNLNEAMEYLEDEKEKCENYSENVMPPSYDSDNDPIDKDDILKIYDWIEKMREE